MSRQRQRNGQKDSIQAPSSLFSVHKFHWEDLKWSKIRHQNKLARESIPKGERQLTPLAQQRRVETSNKTTRSEDLKIVSVPKKSQHVSAFRPLLPCKLSELRHANTRAPAKWASWTDELPFNFEPQDSCTCWLVWYGRHLLLLEAP